MWKVAEVSHGKGREVRIAGVLPEGKGTRIAFLLLAGLWLAMMLLSSCSIAPTLRAAGTQEGLASYYSNDFVGRKTSDGEIFSNTKFTAAHRTLPFGTKLHVVNLSNQKSVDVRVNDRGPVKPERIIDLTLAAAKQIGLDKTGLTRVRLEILELGVAR